jgi:O-antigen/teichoic acid export membrane protein
MGAVSVWYLVQGLVGAGLGLALVPMIGKWGLLLGWLVGTIAAVAYTSWQSRDIARLAPLPSRDSATLIMIGLPMLLFIASSLAMRTLDRLIILRFLGTEALGYYSLGVMVIAFFMTLPDSITYVLYPQLVSRYRAGGDDPQAIRAVVERALRALSLLLPALSAAAYLVADDAVGWLLPKYVPGVPSLRILCFGATGLALGNLASIVLMTLGRQFQLIPCAAALTALAAVLDVLAIRGGFGIRGVAWATFFAFVLNGAIVLALASSKLRHGWRQWLAFVIRIYVPLAIALPLAWAVQNFLPLYGRPGLLRFARLALEQAAFLAAYALLVLPFARGIGIRQLVSEFNWPWSGKARRDEAAGG